MTTKVTIDTHAGWPVLVRSVNGEPGNPPTFDETIVEPNATGVFYIHSGSRITSIRELPRSEN